MTGTMNIASATVPAQAGYDHGWYSYSPLPARNTGAWPGERPLAVVVLVDVRAAEWEESPPAVEVPGGRGSARFPDVPRLSHREYGHRVGLFRLAKTLAEAGVPWAAVVDVLSMEHYPAVRDLILGSSAEVVAGGLSASRPVTSLMAPEEENHYVRSTLDRIESATGRRPRTWMSPGWSQSDRTPGTLAAAGVEAMLDLANDEQAYPVEGARPLWSVPVSWELSDVAAMFHRDVEPETHAEAVLEAVRVLASDGAAAPRLLCLHLHPWLSGEPARARSLRRVLASLAEAGDVWLTVPTAVLAHARREIR